MTPQPALRTAGSAVLLLLVVLVASCAASAPDDEPRPAGPGPAASSSASPSDLAVPAEVVDAERVIDGDTIQVALDGGRVERVRLIGIDTPETYPEVECGGPEATAAARELIRPGDQLQLLTDPTQDEVDRHGRLLRYVETAGGDDVGRALVELGAADTYVFRGVPFARFASYDLARRDAEAQGLGLWGVCR